MRQKLAIKINSFDVCNSVYPEKMTFVHVPSILKVSLQNKQKQTQGSGGRMAMSGCMDNTWKRKKRKVNLYVAETHVSHVLNLHNLLQFLSRLTAVPQILMYIF